MTAGHMHVAAVAMTPSPTGGKLYRDMKQHGRCLEFTELAIAIRHKLQFRRL